MIAEAAAEAVQGGCRTMTMMTTTIVVKVTATAAVTTNKETWG